MHWIIMWNILTWFLCSVLSRVMAIYFQFGPVKKIPLYLLFTQVLTQFWYHLHRTPLQRMLRDSKAIQSSSTHLKQNCSPQTMVLNPWSENWDPTGKSSRMLELVYMVLMTVSYAYRGVDIIKHALKKSFDAVLFLLSQCSLSAWQALAAGPLFLTHSPSSCLWEPL